MESGPAGSRPCGPGGRLGHLEAAGVGGSLVRHYGAAGRRGGHGAGLAFEAATAVLRAAADELPDQPVLVVTQTANERSLKLATRIGFQHMGTFEAHDALQTLAVADLH
ncbi:GNAT family N-acetyltransferase [Streptomyces rishiriensis]|uniref:GNAT family N-acetyltransferase n=1 Tax=Streptomyces rishiriensis TaxID=68264 RepID=UPI0037D8DE34